MTTFRIRTIASLVGKNSTVLDVGTDHAYLPIYLVKNKLVKKAYASDVSKNALDSAIKNIKDENLNIKTFLSDGLKSINVSFDTLIITGMGFYTIKKILESGKISDTIIIQSNSDHFLLRSYMMDLGYKIETEITLKDKKIYYVIIKYIKGIEKLNKYELLLGKSKNKEYLIYLKEKNKKIFKDVPLKKKLSLIKLNIMIEILLKKYRA